MLVNLCFFTECQNLVHGKLVLWDVWSYSDLMNNMYLISMAWSFLMAFITFYLVLYFGYVNIDSPYWLWILDLRDAPWYLQCLPRALLVIGHELLFVQLGTNMIVQYTQYSTSGGNSYLVMIQPNHPLL